MGQKDTTLGNGNSSSELGDELRERLVDLGYAGWPHGPSAASAWELWSELFARWDRRITLIDLYQLEAAARGIPVARLPQSDRARMATQVWQTQFPGWSPADKRNLVHEPVVVVAYDPGWTRAFAEWELRLSEVLGPVPDRLDHVGSTAVPGLAAKPVIDIQLSVPKLEDESTYAPRLKSVGLPLRTRDDLHRFFCPPPAAPRTVHIHVCQSGSTWERDHLLFRDYLRNSPETRQQYGEVKRDLASRWRDDRPAYTDAKSNFILDAMNAAEGWAASTGWSVVGAEQ